MRLRPALGIGAVLLACAACGGDEEIGFGGAPPATSDTPQATSGAPPSAESPGPPLGDPVNPQPPPGATPVPASRVDASALPDGYPRVVWTVGDGSTIGAYGQAGGCIEATAEATEQTGQRVVMRITETTLSTGPCTMEISFPPLMVTLDAPLGDRTVVLTRRQAGPG